MLKILKFNKHNYPLHIPNHREEQAAIRLGGKLAVRWLSQLSDRSLSTTPPNKRVWCKSVLQNQPQGTPPPISPILLLPNPILTGGLHKLSIQSTPLPSVFTESLYSVDWINDRPLALCRAHGHILYMVSIWI